MTQCDQILKYLETHAGITALDALRQIGSFRLAARIKDLRSQGHNIVTVMKEVETSSGDTARVAEYRLVRS